MKDDVTMYVVVGDDATIVSAEVASYGVVSRYRSSIGSTAFDEAILLYIRKKYNLLIGERTAATIRQELGAAMPVEQPRTMELRARHAIERAPQTIILHSEEMSEALAGCVSLLMEGVRVAIEQMPAEIRTKIQERGIILKGGEVLKDLDRRLAQETDLPVTVMDRG